ncbi:MucBP domain-containing protein, partial [Lactobacillus kimbladii]
MKTHKNIYKQGEKLFVGGMTAAAIGFFSANPKAVKADSLSAGYLMAQNVQSSSKTQLSKAVPTESTSTDSFETEQSETMDKDAANDQQLNNSNSSQETNDSNNINDNDNSANSSAASEKNNTDLVDSDISKRDTENPNIVESNWNNIKVSYDTTQKSLTIYGGTKEKPVAVSNPNPILGTSDTGYIAGVNPLDITDIKIDGQLKLSGSVKFLFHGLTKLKTIEGLDNLDTSEVTDMSEMFSDSTMLLKLDLSNFNTVKVTRMYNMFHNCINLRYLDIHSFNMANTSNVAGMLLTLESLKVLVLGKDNKIGLSDFQNKARWNSLGSGSISNPEGTEKWRSEDIEKNYHSNNISDTFISTIANPVFVHFRDEKGNQVTDQNGKIVPDTVEVGDIGTSKAPEDFDCYKNANITNYTLKKIFINGSEVTPGSAEDIVNFELSINNEQPNICANQDVTFVFGKEQIQSQTLTVSYHDPNGKTLKDDFITSVTSKKSTTVTADEIKGYTLVKVWVNGKQVDFDPNVAGQYSTEISYSDDLTEQNVVFVYEPDTESNVTVFFQDEKGKDLAEPVHLSGTFGSTYESKPQTISGWHLKTTPANASGTFTTKEQKVIYVYEPDAESNVTVFFQDEKGKDLAEPVHLSGNFGSAYESKPQTIT